MTAKKILCSAAAVTLFQPVLVSLKANASGEPLLSLKINNVSSYTAKAGETVTMTYEVEGADSWSATGVHINYDSRIIPAETKSNGTPVFSRGDASENIDMLEIKHLTGEQIYSLPYDETIPVNLKEYVEENQNCAFIYSADSSESGTNGVILSINFIVPEDAAAGDVYKFEFWQLYSDLFTDTNHDYAMQEFAFSNWQNAEIVIAGLPPTLQGDANEDGQVNVSDVVAVSAFVSNAKNALSEQGKANADVHNTGNGLNASDAFAIQQFSTGVITQF